MGGRSFTHTGWYLSEEGLLVGHFVLQLVIEVVDGRGLPLCCQVAFLQRGDPLLHVFLLSHGLHPHMDAHHSGPLRCGKGERSFIPLAGLAAAAYWCPQT